MRFIIISLLTLLPALAFASPPEPKDKYLTCNCHVTPGVSSLGKIRHKTGHKHKAVHASPTVEKPHPRVARNYSPKALRSVTLSDRYPGREAIIPSNKLALPAGKAVYPKGELVFLSGRVLDENCVPVSDAIVDIWQLDPQGKYVKSTLGDRISPDPHFTGSGRAITNNLGQFNFVTLFPGTRGKQAPHINVHVIHAGLGTLDTKMFFDGDRRNADDSRIADMAQDKQKLLLAKIWPQNPNDPEKGLNAQWDISMPGKNPWRHF